MVYLIHFDKPFKHARHYLGYTANERMYLKRIQHHRTNRGSRLLAAVNRAGIKWEVVRTWTEADGNFEQRIKACGNIPKYCPICRKTRKR